MPEERSTITIQDGRIPNLCILREKPTRYNVHEMRSRRSFGATDVDYWIKDTLLDLIASAKEKIFLATFLMVYPEVEQALMEASERLRGHVYVLTPLDNSVYKEPHRQNELSPEELAIAMVQQEERITALSQAGVYIREHRQCHAKFCVVDSARALVMSSNLTERSMKENPELGKIVENQFDVLALDRLFQRMWVHGAEYELVPSKVRPDSKSIPHREECDDSITFEPEHELIWTYHENHHLLDAIIRIITSAKSSLKIGSYVLRELHSKNGNEKAFQVLQALQDALTRGVQVEIVIHVPYESSKIIQNEKESMTYQQLFSHALADNFRLYGHQKNHAKYVIADDVSGVFFTANLDGRYGLTNGIEVGLLLNDHDDIAWLGYYHAKLVDEAHRTFVCEPFLSELNHIDEIHMLSVRTIRVHTKKNQTSLRYQQQVTDLMKHQFLAWSRIPGQERAIKVWPWPDENQGIVLIQNSNDSTTWDLSTTQNMGCVNEEDIIGFLLPGDVSVVGSWPYSINELKQKVNSRVQEVLKKEPAIPLSSVSAFWIGLSSSDLPFPDSSEEWVTRLRTLLLDANLELRGPDWWIRTLVRDEEIMEVIETHIADEKLDINATMNMFQEKGWQISGITTGEKKLRQFYEQQTGFKVRKDGTIISEETNE